MKNKRLLCYEAITLTLFYWKRYTISKYSMKHTVTFFHKQCRHWNSLFSDEFHSVLAHSCVFLYIAASGIKTGENERGRERWFTCRNKDSEDANFFPKQLHRWKFTWHFRDENCRLRVCFTAQLHLIVPFT